MSVPKYNCVLCSGIFETGKKHKCPALTEDADELIAGPNEEEFELAEDDSEEINPDILDEIDLE